MENYFFIVSDYLKGKPVYQPISRILNLLFSISIASFIFEKFYFHYSWLDVSDYKGILNFLIKGHFVVPFSIFIIVHYILAYGSDGIFTLATYKAVGKWQKDVYDFKIKKSEGKALLKRLNKNTVVSLPRKIDIPTVVQWYQAIKATTNTATWNRMNTQVEKMKININRNFNLAIKSLIVISIYFYIVPYFGWLLYMVVIFVIIGLIVGMRLGYIIAEILPLFIRKLITEAENYLNGNKPQDHGETLTVD